MSTIEALHLEKVAVEDPVLHLEAKKHYSLFLGASNNTFTSQISTSYSDSSIQISAPPPNQQIVIDSRLFIGIPYQITITGSTTDGLPLLDYGVSDGFRAYPVEQIINTCQVTFNNNTITLNVSDVFPALHWCESNKEQLENDVFSMSPTYMDQFQNYEDGIGTLRNPLLAYDGVDGHQIKRGSQVVNITQTPDTPVSGVTPWTSIVTGFLIGAIPMSPFNMGLKQVPGFYGLQTFNFNFTMGDLTRAFCTAKLARRTISTALATIKPTQALPNINGIPTAAPVLFFRYLTPRINQMIPDVQVYPYYNIDRYPTDLSTPIAAGATYSNFASSNINLQQIPRRIILFVRANNNSRQTVTGMSVADAFLQIYNVSVNWNNRNNQLTSCTLIDLYQIAKKNGVNMTFEQWSGISQMSGASPANLGLGAGLFGSVGSILPLEFGDDIPLEPGEAPGVLGTYQLQVTISVRNVNPSKSISATFYIAVVSEGVMMLYNNQCETRLGIVRKEEVLDAHDWPKVHYHDIKDSYGGDLFGKIKNFWNSAKPWVQPLWNAAKDYASMAGMGLPSGDSSEEEVDFGNVDWGDIDLPNPVVQNKRKASGGEILRPSELKKRKMTNY